MASSSVHDTRSPASALLASWPLVVILAIACVVPLALRPVAAFLAAGAPPSYVPSLESARVRRPFDPAVRETLRAIQPAYVFIGDSTLGSRIDPQYLTRVLHRPVWWVMQPGTGPAYWYLGFKNAVLGAGLRPRAVFVFFRDYTLTDVLFRLDDQFRWSVDTMAGAMEPELDRAVARRLEGPWYFVPRTLDRAYRYAVVRGVAEAVARSWPAKALAGPGGAEPLQRRLNDAFALDKLRPSLAADLASGEDELGDFARMLPRSVLPDFVALARSHGVRLCFVRVQRRPRPDGRPPEQSETLRRYVADLRRYLESNGVAFRDDTGDPDYPLAWYTDGDHTAFRYRQQYSDLFVQKLGPLFQVIFHSLDFVVFFIVTVAVYWALPHRAQNLWLLVTSYVFYGYVHPWFLLLIAFSTTLDWWAALRMEADPGRRTIYLGLSIASNMGMLCWFKYFNFFAANVGQILSALGLAPSMPVLNVLLPVGISFFTFQALSYTVDVYRGQLQARRSLVDVATFVALFPQLVAGPIERATHLLPQVEGERRFSVAAARSGLLLMAWGYFKKLVVADSAGVVANKVFGVQAPGFALLWAGVFAFGLQIYADFSAYSDIARGTARWLGFELMVNFDQPYFARGPRDFWRRWHISLSTWFRDYVYVPLGGSRRGPGREMANIMATFMLSGLWHGASWNYVLWGTYHGALLVGSRLAGRLPWRPGATAAAVLLPLRIAATFVLVHIGWLMFRETDTAMLLRDLRLSPWMDSALDRQAALSLVLMLLPFAVPLYLEGVWVEWRRRRGAPGPSYFAADVGWWRLAGHGVFVGLVLTCILLFRSRTSLDFIYFQF